MIISFINANVIVVTSLDEISSKAQLDFGAVYQ